MKYKLYLVWMSLALMAFGMFVYSHKTVASTEHKVLLIAPITLACLITSLWALIAKSEPSTRAAWTANMGTFIAFEIIRYVGHG